MTEETTTVTATDLLDFIRIAVRLGNNRKAHEALCDLDSALTSGSPLPAQWPQAKELEGLRAKVAKYEKALDDRRTVEGWANAPDEERFYIVSRHIGNGKFTVTLTDMALMDPTDYEEGAIGPIHEYEFEFLGDTPDEAFSSAAEWVRHQ